MKYSSKFFLLFLFSVSSCTVDYETGTMGTLDSNRIVINACLNPNLPVRVDFYTIDKDIDGKFSAHPAKGMQVKLTENETILFDGVCQDSVLALDYYPQVHAVYRIEANCNGYEPVWAETAVPDSVDCRIRKRKKNSLSIYTLSHFDKYEDNLLNAIYIKVYARQNDSNALVQLTDLYSSNPLIDNINLNDGMEPIDEEIGSSYFENFMRIKKKNIARIDSLVFSGNSFYGDRELTVKIITANADYDRYIRTFYRQAQNVVYEDLDAMFYQPVQVYGNIHGGFGIFAGINEKILLNP